MDHYHFFINCHVGLPVVLTSSILTVSKLLPSSFVMLIELYLLSALARAWEFVRLFVLPTNSSEVSVLVCKRHIVGSVIESGA